MLAGPTTMLQQLKRTLLASFFGSSLCIMAITAQANELAEHKVEDLDYGRALFHFYKRDDLAAITELLVGQEKRPDRKQLNESDLLLADMYFRYGLYFESEILFDRLLKSDETGPLKNRVWMNLAKLYYEQGYPDKALELMNQITQALPQPFEQERQYILTNLYLANKQPQEAIKASNSIRRDSIWKAYADYNLAIHFATDDQNTEAVKKLSKLSNSLITDAEEPAEELVTLRDQSYLSAGLISLQDGKPANALPFLEKVRLESPLSQTALLAAGQAWYKTGNFEKALNPWLELSRRNRIDPATQEALLAIPSGYEEQQREKLAIHYYRKASDLFDTQLNTLDSISAKIESGELIQTLENHSILENRARYRNEPPNSDTSPYLYNLMASQGFQQETQRYQELLDILSSLDYWQNNLPVFGVMLNERRRNFEQKLPLIESSLDIDQLVDLKSQRDQYARQLNDIESNKKFRALVNEDELDFIESFNSINASIATIGDRRDTSDELEQFAFLQGILDYQLETEFPKRFWKARKQLIALNRAIEKADDLTASLQNASDRANNEFLIYGSRIDDQNIRINQLAQATVDLLDKQAAKINGMASQAIKQQQNHLLQLQIHTRFAITQMYDKYAEAN